MGSNPLRLKNLSGRRCNQKINTKSVLSTEKVYENIQQETHRTALSVGHFPFSKKVAFFSPLLM